MTVEELLALHDVTSQRCKSIMAVKNADYTGGSGDPFANFRMTESLGIPAELGILIRIMDKIQRVRSFVEKGKLQVKNESVEDALEDIINYAILIKGMVKEKELL